MAIGVPIAWSLGVSGVIALLVMDFPLMILPQKVFGGMNSFPLLCLPFFVLAGELMGSGGMTRRLLNFAVTCVGFIPGGLALANVVASMLFGGITGAATADASALGSIEIPMMEKNGYDSKFAAAITAASACIGPIIPPSLVVVIYAMVIRDASIAGLFAAGMIPGILVGLALMATCYVISIKRGYPKSDFRPSFKEFFIGLKDALLSLITPVIILGGIIGGVFTATEAAAVAVVYSFIIAFFVYKELKLRDLPDMFLKTGIISAVVMIIIGTSTLFGMVITFEQLADQLEKLIEPLGYYGFILAVNITFLFFGMFMDMVPAILILAPVFAPIATSLGMAPVHFGIIVIINLVIGLITPPLGQVLFVVCQISGVSFESLSKEILIFVFVEVFVLFLVSYIPFFACWVPSILGYL